MKRLLILTSILLFSSFVFTTTFAQEKKSTKSLHQAVIEGNFDQVRQLILEGADVNAKDQAGYTPLSYVAERGQNSLAETLIAAGANVNVTDNYGNTPLHYAAMRGHYDMCKLLVTKGANTGTKNLMGGTPLGLARAGDHLRVVELLQTSGSKENVFAGSKDRISLFQPRPETPTALGYGGAEPGEKGSEIKSQTDYDLLIDPNKIQARINAFAGLEQSLKEVDRRSDNEIREWLQKTVDNRISLARAVHEQIRAEILFIRKLAVEEGAKKTTAAIDGLLLNRQKRFERLIEKMEEEAKDLRRMRGTTTTGRSRPGYPSTRRGYPQDRRTRGPVPKEEIPGQEQYIQEDNPPKSAPPRR